jgi:polyadenylate-binding protein
MNGSIVGSKKLYVALAQRKEERRMHLTNQLMQRLAISRVPPPMQLPFPNGMGGMMSYLPTPIGQSQLPNYFSQTAMPSYLQPQPRWSSTATAIGMRPPTNAQMIGMQMPQSAMAGMASRTGMPMSTRPTPILGQMMPSGFVRPQGGVHSQQATAYTRTARNMPPNVNIKIQI